MKKIVPDPPRPKTPNTPFFTVQSDMYPPDALAHVSELLRASSKPSTNIAEPMLANLA